MKKILLTGFFFLLFFDHHAFASEALLKNFLLKVNTMNAHFEQVVSDETGAILSQTKGKFYLRKPEQFRWDYQSEFDADEIGQQIIANAGIISVYDPDLQQMTTRSMLNAIEQVPSLVLLQKSEDISAYFKVSDLGEIDNKSWVSLKPKKEDVAYSQLLLGFVGKEIRQIDLIDMLGNETQLKFYLVELNESINTDLFDFSPPAGTDVFEQ